MNERAKLAVKAPEAKRENSFPHRQKTNYNYSQSRNSHVDQILFPQRTIGNQAVQRLIKSGALQAKLKIGQPGDIYEQEANQIADQVMATPIDSTVSDAPLRIQRFSGQSNGQMDSAPSSVEHALASPGRPLETALRKDMEQRFGHDFSRVRVHSGEAAEQSARDLNAHAYAVGYNMVFGAGRFAPGTHEGRRLIAHELMHVVQQSSVDENSASQSNEKRGLSPIHFGRHLLAHKLTKIVQQQAQAQVQRELIPQELRSSVNVREMKPDELQARYDLIVQTMKQFNSSTPDYRELEVEMQRIANELARRQALKGGHTFGDTEVAKMKDYFIKNATSANPKSCIACMNEAMRLLLGDPQQKVGSEVEKTMAKLQQSGHAGNAQVIEFEDAKGRITKGTLFPDKLHESVWDAVIQIAGGDIGWSVFGMSLMDGYHSVTLTLDNSDPLTPHIYWSDQWSTKGGWKEYNKAMLDAEITRLTQAWWGQHDEKHKPNTRTTLWRLNP